MIIDTRCGHRLDSVADERVIASLTMSDYLAGIDSVGTWVSASF